MAIEQERTTQQKLLEMELHQTIEFNCGLCMTYMVTKVFNGYIYNYVRLDSNAMTSVFVPHKTH